MKHLINNNMADPLSIAATKLPASSFDPVEFASEERKRLLNEQTERRTRYNQMADQIASISAGNPWDQGLREAKSTLMDEMGGTMADGVDITDYSDKETGKLAWEYKNKVNKLLGDAQMSKLIKELVDNTQQMLAKDDATRGGKNAYNRTATIDNIKGLMATKNIDEANKYLSERGDNLLVANPTYVDLPALIKKNLPSAKQTGGKVIEGGQAVTRKYEEYSPQELRTMFSSMLNDPDTVRTVKRDKEADVTSLNESDLDYLMRTYGNQLARKQTFEFKEPYIPKETKTEEKKYEQVTEPVETLIGNYKATGRNVVTFKQQKPIKVTAGENIVDIESGKNKPISTAITLTPINTAEYYVLNKSKGVGFPKGTIITDVDVSRGTRFKPEDYEKKRFVEGTYPVKKTVKGKAVDATNTVLIPYDNIKNELDAEYKIKGDIPETSKRDDRYSVGGQTFSRQDLIDKGYSDVQIDKAIEANKIKKL